MSAEDAVAGQGSGEREARVRSLARLRGGEAVFWLAPLAAFVFLPQYLVLGSQILITALFALSLDLILGYAGIVSLGHGRSSESVPTARACSPCTAGASR
jgi:branched-chain amino acid transport system permease protein